jgi:hypothetical protein
MEKTQFTCKTCKEKTTKVGHLCDPKTVAKNIPVYICAECGLITTEKNLICKPKILRLK